jgi:ABC-type multidrug transport system ATPase subunit
MAFIQHGKIIAYGAAEEIKKTTMTGQVLELEPSDAPRAVEVLRAAQARQALAIQEVELYGALVHVLATDAQKQQRAVERELRQAGIRAGHVSIIEPSLEDVFISAMKA